jgi:hypothetical protein
VTTLNDDDLDLVLLFACSLDEKPGSNWVQEAGGLPDYICRIAKAVKKTGKTTSSAIAIAISRVKKWAATGDADTKPKAAAALAEWEKLKAKSHASSAASKIAATNVLNLAGPDYSMDQVRSAFEKRQREYRNSLPQSKRYEDGTSMYVREVWSNWLIAKGDYSDGAKKFKIPYTVDKDGTVTFGDATEVKVKYVEVESSPELGSAMSDTTLKRMIAMTSPCREENAAERLLRLTDVEEAYLDPTSWIELGVRRVRSIEGARFYGSPVGSIITRDLVDKAKAKHGTATPPKGAVVETVGDKIKPSGPYSPSSQVDARPASGVSPESSVKGNVAPGQYNVGGSRSTGKAHMLVKADGSGVYVNSRGEEKPISAAEVKKQHTGGMNRLTAQSAASAPTASKPTTLPASKSSASPAGTSDRVSELQAQIKKLVDQGKDVPFGKSASLARAQAAVKRDSKGNIVQRSSAVNDADRKAMDAKNAEMRQKSAEKSHPTDKGGLITQSEAAKVMHGGAGREVSSKSSPSAVQGKRSVAITPVDTSREAELRTYVDMYSRIADRTDAQAVAVKKMIRAKILELGGAKPSGGAPGSSPASAGGGKAPSPPARTEAQISAAISEQRNLLNNPTSGAAGRASIKEKIAALVDELAKVTSAKESRVKLTAEGWF